MRRWALAAAVAVAASTAPAARAAAGDIVLSGSTSGYVDVELPPNTSIQRWSISGRGRFAGFYAVPRPAGTAPSGGGDFAVGALVLRDLRTPSGDTPELLLGPAAMNGTTRYRVYLIADGPTSVRLHTNGAAPERRLTPTRTLRAAARVDALPATPVTGRRAPVDASGSTLAVAALMVTGPAPAADDVDVCLTGRGADCQDPVFPDALTGRQVEHEPAAARDTRLWSVAGRLPAGRYDLVQRTASPLRVDRAVAASFVLPLP